MRTKKITTVLALFAIAIFLMAAANAGASTISGQGWFVSNATAGDAIPANVPLTAPDVTFDVNGINFSSISGGNDSAFYELGQWLGTGGAFNIVYAAPGDATTNLSDGSTTGMMFEFTGSAFFTNGQSFTVAHDDGLTAIVGGLTVINDPGPTPPTTTTGTYTGPTGTQTFDFVYGECCGAPAVFQTTLVPPSGSGTGQPSAARHGAFGARGADSQETAPLAAVPLYDRPAGRFFFVQGAARWETDPSGSSAARSREAYSTNGTVPSTQIIRELSQLTTIEIKNLLGGEPGRPLLTEFLYSRPSHLREYPSPTAEATHRNSLADPNQNRILNHRPGMRCSSDMSQ